MGRTKTIITGVIILIFILTIFAIKSIVNSHIPDTKIPGIYYDNILNVGKDTVVINSNHHYRHSNQQGNSLKIQQGRWKYKNGEITLYDYNKFNSSNSDKVIWIADVSEDNGTIKIDINTDIDEFYVKLK